MNGWNKSHSQKHTHIVKKEKTVNKSDLPQKSHLQKIQLQSEKTQCQLA